MNYNMYKQALSWDEFRQGTSDFGKKLYAGAKDAGNAAFQYAQENPWTAAGALALPIAGIVGLSSKRRNKLMNFLITLASVWGGGGLGMMAFNKWAPNSWKGKAPIASPPESTSIDSKSDIPTPNTDEMTYKGPAVTGDVPHLNPELAR